MSFYEIQSNPNLKIKDPLLLVNSALSLINSNIVVPTATTVISSPVAVTITADQMLSGLIVRTVLPITGAADTLDSATNIITALRNKYHSLKSNDLASMPNGTRFSFTIINKSPIEYTLTGDGNGVSWDNGPSEIASGNANIFSITVTSQTALGDASNTVTAANLTY